MGLIITRRRLDDDLARLFGSVRGDAVALHTDLRRIGIVERVKPRDQALDEYLDALRGAAEGRTLLFPTFNYDFCRTGVFDVAGDPCQVGVLNEHARLRHPGQRTRTPVFSFCILDNRGFSLDASEDPLSAGSTFGELVRRGGEIALLGTDVSADTLFHHVEELAEVGYRYPKRFAGTVRADGEERDFAVTYRVRPRVDGVLGDEVEYDCGRLLEDALRDGVFRKLPVGNGWCYLHGADTLVDYWSACLARDELYFLTPASRVHVQALYARHGRPLRGDVGAGAGRGAAVTDPLTGAVMSVPSTAPRGRFRFERFPFMIGVRTPGDGAALPQTLPFEMAVDPRAALPRLVVTDEVEAALRAAYAIGSMISTPLGHSALSMNRLEEARDRLLGLLGDVRGMRMLEIGCGTGMLLNEFKTRGADVAGCEIGPQGAEAEARYGIPVLREPLRAGSFEQPFDCIYSYGTLEHIADLEGLFEAFRASLRDGGLLFHSVPNADNTFRTGRVEELLHEHVNYFAPVNAVRLLEAQGFVRARAEPTAAGNELHLWGWRRADAPVGWPGEREPEVLAAEHARVAEFFGRAQALLDGQQAAVERMLKAGESVGFYAGGYLLGARLPAGADVRYYDGDEYKHGKVWLAGLSPIRPPAELRTDPVDNLIVCPDHYFEPIHAHLVERVGIPAGIRMHRMRGLRG